MCRDPMRKYGRTASGSQRWRCTACNLTFRSESAEIRRLRAELRNARMENEFLKKAAAYFAREQK